MTSVQAKFQAAMGLHKQGRLAEAAKLYEEVLAIDKAHVAALHCLGVIVFVTGNAERGAALMSGAARINPGLALADPYLGAAFNQLGRYGEALAVSTDAVKRHPDSAEAHFNLGNAFSGLGRLHDALASYDRAVALRPGISQAWYNRGKLLGDLQRWDEALASYDRAVTANPGYAQAHSNRGNILNDLGRFEEALTSYDKAIQLKPDYAEAFSNRATALQSLDRLEQALADQDKAIQLKPDYAEAHSNRGTVLGRLGRREEALASFDRAIALKADFADAWYNRGNFLQNDWTVALASYDRAIALRPDYAEAWSMRGAALLNFDRVEEALASFDRAISLKPDFVEAHSNRGNALHGLQRLEEALVSYDKAIALKPDDEFIRGTILYTRTQLCDWTGLPEGLARLELGIRAKKYVTLPFNLISLIDSGPLQKMAAQICAEQRYPAADPPRAYRSRPEEDKIRIGYYSADFHNHATTYLMAEMLELHDTSRFELYGFSFGPDRQDDMRRRVASAFHKFSDISNKSDRDVARYSRELGIDIAIDLKGYTRDGRLGIFAERCAPIQVSYLGYPGTTGATYMDYIIADRIVIPKERRDDYTESVVCLPDSYQVNDSKRKISDKIFARAELGLPEAGFVFCCFNGNYKILPDTFDIWMRLLKSVEGSVLWLVEDSRAAANNLRKEAEKRGVAGARLIFANRMPLPEHLARHRAADLFLDTLPCNAHTTASDALWAGLPVLTCAGQAFAGRVAASLLQADGLPELITQSLPEYEAVALDLARNPEKLSDIRQKLAHNRSASPLFDARRYTRHLEAAYQAMMDRHQAGLAPESIDIAG